MAWDTEPVNVTAGDILAAADGNSADRSARDEAMELLADLLRDGPVLQADVRSQCDAAGLSWTTVKRAKKAAGVEASHKGVAGARGAGRWFWHLPGDWPPRHSTDTEIDGSGIKGTPETLRGSHICMSPLIGHEPLNADRGSE